MAPLEMLWWQANQVIGTTVAFIVPAVTWPQQPSISVRGVITGVTTYDQSAMNLSVTVPLFRHLAHGLCRVEYVQGIASRTKRIDRWQVIACSLDPSVAITLNGILYLINPEMR